MIQLVGFACRQVLRLSQKSALRLAVAALAVCTFAVTATAAEVAVLVSDQTRAWYGEVAWDFDSETEALRQVLREANIDFQELTDADLAAGQVHGAKLLILPHTRRMSAAQVEAVKSFLGTGGRLFAVGQASFRNENNEKVSDKSYQLADELGISYFGFSSQPPLHAYARKLSDHPIFDGLPEYIPFHRNWAMINLAEPGATILAAWYNDDQSTPSNADPAVNGAVVLGPAGNAIYVGDMIFMPDAMAIPELRQLAINIIKYLLSM